MSQINYVGLESVGSIVTTDGIVFPIDLSEGPETASDAEEMMGVHLVDTDDDWWNNMSVGDCNELMGFLTENLGFESEVIPGFVNWGMERLQYVINHQYLVENMETI